MAGIMDFWDRNWRIYISSACIKEGRRISVGLLSIERKDFYLRGIPPIIPLIEGCAGS